MRGAPEEQLLVGGRIHMGRAFACLFLYVLGLAGLQTVLVMPLFFPRTQMILWLLAQAPVLQAMRHLYAASSASSSPRMAAYRRRLWGLALAHFLLIPFLGWWRNEPGNYYLAGNVFLLGIVTVWLLMTIVRLVGAWKNGETQMVLSREAGAVSWMILYISVASAAALGVGYARLGLLREGLPAFLFHLSSLPIQGYWMFLLPFVMTLYMLWVAHEVAFQV